MVDRNVHSKLSVLPPTSIASQVSSANGAVTHGKVYDNGTTLVSFASGTSVAFDKSLGNWVRVQENWWSVTAGENASDAFRTAVTLGNLETRLYAAKLLGSPGDYRAVLMTYAGRLAEEGVADRADELVRDLCGPVYWDPAKGDAATWEPKILGLNKRDLLHDILPVLGKHIQPHYRVTTDNFQSKRKSIIKNGAGLAGFTRTN